MYIDSSLGQNGGAEAEGKRVSLAHPHEIERNFLMTPYGFLPSRDVQNSDPAIPQIQYTNQIYG
jgi:hypothetical protein